MLDFSKRFVCAGYDYNKYDRHVPSPAMRKSFTLRAKPEKAEILITGLGFYDLFVNGKMITKGLTAPYISNSDDLIYYDLYDLTDRLREGENVIGIVLGDGMQNPKTAVWNFCDAVHTSSPKTAFNFRAEAGGETVEFDATSLVWKESPITFNDLRSGVHYDARLEEDGWCEAGFDARDWKPVMKAENPRGEAKLCTAEPVKVKEEIPPVSIKKGELVPYREMNDIAESIKGMDIPDRNVEMTGGYIYDFGVNTAGVFRFKIKGAKRGQKISFQCGEYLDEEGRLTYQNIGFYPNGYSQRDIYICRGDKDEEVFVPMFTYHGCRYIYVNGITEEQATKEAMTFLRAHSDMKMRADFRCSNDIVNKLFAMALNSDLSNFWYFPTDCPHREKNGWTGDASASAEHMIMTFTPENSYREWLCNIRHAQNIEGAIPGIIPTAGWGFDWGNGPAWDSVIFNLPYMMYHYRGDTEIIRENRHMMMRYLEYIASKRDDDGLIHIGLGDWIPVDGGKVQPTLALTDSIMVYDMCRKGEEMFCAIGNTLDASYAKNLGDEVKKAIRENLIDFCTMTTTCHSQTGLAMCIYYGIFEGAELNAAGKKLAETAHDEGDNFDVGFLGLHTIFHALAMTGNADLAYHLIAKEDFPSYGYYVNKLPMTSLPESIASTYGALASLNHHFYGDINHFFLRRILGVNVNPTGKDANRIVVAPNFISTLNFAEGHYDAPAGRVYIKWQRDGENVKLTVKADEGVKTEIRLPDGYMFVRDGQNDFVRYKYGDADDMTVIKTSERFKNGPMARRYIC